MRATATMSAIYEKITIYHYWKFTEQKNWVKKEKEIETIDD